MTFLHSQEVLFAVLDLWNEGELTMRQIGEKLNLNRCVIAGIIRRHRKQGRYVRSVDTSELLSRISVGLRRSSQITQKERSEIEEYYRQGLPIGDIAEKVGRSLKLINHVIATAVDENRIEFRWK